MTPRALRYTLLQLALVGLDSIWLALAVLVIGGAAGGGWPFLLTVGLVALGWNRWLLSRKWGTDPAGRILGLLGLFAILLGAGVALYAPLYSTGQLRSIFAERPLLTAWLATVVIVVRTTLLLRHPISLHRTRDWARLPLFGLGAALLLAHAGGVIGGEGRLSSTPVLLQHELLFLGWGLAALALARAVETSRLPRSGSLPFTPRWGLTVAVGIGGALGLGYLLGLPLDPRQWPLLTGLLDAGRTLLITLIGGLITVVAWVLVPIIDFLISTFGRIATEALLPFLRFLLAFGQGDMEAGARLSPLQVRLLGIGVSAVCILIPLLLLYQLYNLYRAVRRADELDEAELEEIALALALADWWQERRNALKAFWGQLLRPRFGLDSVYDLYRNLLQFGDAHALPRPTADTPYEYLTPLCTRYPTLTADFHALTDGYVAARYGERAFSDDEIRALQRAWHRIETYSENNKNVARERVAPAPSPHPLL